jgi:hypothetical protein
MCAHSTLAPTDGSEAGCWMFGGICIVYKNISIRRCFDGHLVLTEREKPAKKPVPLTGNRVQQ